MARNTSQTDDDLFDPEAEFESLLATTAPAERPFIEPGSAIRGVVTHVGDRYIELDVGDGREGLLDQAELGPQGELPKVGDVINGHAVGVRNRVVEVGLGNTRGPLDLGALYSAHETGQPIEGRVAEVNKGGYVVEIGSHRAFCPLGMIDTRRVEDPETLIGSKLTFQVIEMRDGRDPVVSRRAVLVAEREARAAETRLLLVPGGRFRGEVVNVRDFGVFVDIGGVEGLVHRSELGYGRREPSEVVQVGQLVEVEVISIGPDPKGRGERISLSMKSLEDDPFDTAWSELPIGVILEGKVTRVQPFGAFVEIANGIEGLLHVSAFGKRIGSPFDMCKAGQDIVVRVLAVDPTLRRISLAWVERSALEELIDAEVPTPQNSLGARALGMARTQGDEAEAVAATERAQIGDVVEVQVDRHAHFGVFVSWPGGEGLVPARELGVPQGTDLRRRFPEGCKIEAEVIDIDAAGRVRLSSEAAAKSRERTHVDAWRADQRKPIDADKLSDFGKLLKEKLGS